MPLSQLLLAKAMKVEVLAAEIYLHLATRFAEDATLQDLFRRLSTEERQHELRLHLLGSVSRHDRALDTFNTPVEASIDMTIQEAEILHDLASAPASELTEEEALRMAHHLEVNMAAVHAEAMLIDADAQVKQVFEHLAKQDRAHAALLLGRGE